MLNRSAVGAIYAIVTLGLCFSAKSEAQDADKDFARSCPPFSAKTTYYDSRFKKLGEMAKEGMENGNTPVEICKVLNEQVSFFGEMLNDLESCRPYTTLKINDFATTISSKITIAQQQRQGLGCR